MSVDRDDKPIGNPLSIGGAPGMTPGMVGTRLDSLDPEDLPLDAEDDESVDLDDEELSDGADDGE